MNSQIVLSILCLLGFSSVHCQVSEGYGCAQGNLPNEVREDCHPEPNANETACRSRGCVWCDPDPSANGQNFPNCFFRDVNYEPSGPSCDVGYVAPQSRVDCTNGGEPIGEMGCRYRNCTWCPDVPGSTAPWCFVPAAIDNVGYEMVGQPIETPTGIRVVITKSFKSISPQFEGEVETLSFEAEFQADYRLRIKISPERSTRFEVPLQIDAPNGGNGNLMYNLTFTPSPFSFKVTRRSNGLVLFDSSAGKLQFADQFITLSWSLPSENVYGIGENEQRSFRHDFSERLKYTLYASDQAPYFTSSLYGTHPQYTVLEDGGNAHVVAIINSNAQEFQMLPGPSIKYITIGGVLDMYFFLGPTPDDTVKQFTEAVGRSQMPAYWSLGFQLCRWGYDTLENMQAAVNRTEFYGIPHDVQYGDIDIMRDELDFTYSEVKFPGLPDYVLELKAKGIKFVTILDPAISIIEPPDYEPFTLGQEMDVWVKKQDGSPMTGRVWPHGSTAPAYFPDYFKPSTRDWWIYLVAKFHDLLAYDGLWIDMNEPANFENGDMYEGCANTTWNYPPYQPKTDAGKADMHFKTLCGDHVHEVDGNAESHYNTHSLYGWSQSEPTLIGARQGTGKRSLVLSRSTFIGSQRWASHWLGDNWSHWSNLHFSIIGVMQFNLWGMSYVGPDTCGFIGDSTAAMCQRWGELGAFYPFSRNHNVMGARDQDPGAWGAEVAASTKTALEVRYTLLPYLYTLFYHSVSTGTTVFRPLWYNYPQDPETYSIDRQFMWGSGLLISPVLEEAVTEIDAYFPDVPHYSYYTGEKIPVRGQTTTLDAPLDFINVHVVGGNILPTQEPARNTEAARQLPMGLIVALDDGGNAYGDLFYDDGDSIETHLSGDYFYATYTMGTGTLTNSVVHDGYAEMGDRVLDTIRLFGAAAPVTSVVVNGVPHQDFETVGDQVIVSNLNLAANSEFRIIIV